MSNSPTSPGEDEDVTALVSELETTLSDLRAELAERERTRRRPDEGDRRPIVDRGGRRGEQRDRSRPPSPPDAGELFRFTSDYTIPTVVAILEATIEALELLRAVIDLAAPGESRPRRRTRAARSRRGGSRGLARTMLSDAVADGVTSATDRAATDAADALARLRETLSEADLPEDEASRDLVDDARDLSAELEQRVRESRGVVDSERARERRADRAGARDSDREVDGGDGPVSIDVGAPGADDDRAEDGSDGDAQSDEEPPAVDVDAELESIKRQVGSADPAATGETDEAVDSDSDTDADHDSSS